MAEDERLKSWETLFQRALKLIDSVSYGNIKLEDWSFGGGTVLMRRYRHRFSKDIDIFVPDPQYLGYLTPRLNPYAETLTDKYVEQNSWLKLYFLEGEIDFVASAPITRAPTVKEQLFGRDVDVETSVEIIAKKVWHRGGAFTARDIFDLAMVVENDPTPLHEIEPIFRDRRAVILERIASQEAMLREAFAGLDVLDYRRNFDECVTLVRRVLQ